MAEFESKAPGDKPKACHLTTNSSSYAKAWDPYPPACHLTNTNASSYAKAWDLNNHQPVISPPTTCHLTRRREISI